MDHAPVRGSWDDDRGSHVDACPKPQTKPHFGGSDTRDLRHYHWPGGGPLGAAIPDSQLAVELPWPLNRRLIGIISKVMAPRVVERSIVGGRIEEAVSSIYNWRMFDSDRYYQACAIPYRVGKAVLRSA